jgi:hypothetical protein
MAKSRSPIPAALGCYPYKCLTHKQKLELSSRSHEPSSRCSITCTAKRRAVHRLANHSHYNPWFQYGSHPRREGRHKRRISIYSVLSAKSASSIQGKEVSEGTTNRLLTGPAMYRYSRHSASRAKRATWEVCTSPSILMPTLKIPESNICNGTSWILTRFYEFLSCRLFHRKSTDASIGSYQK